MEKKRINLDELKRNVPFDIPKGYFEELPSIIQSRLPATPERRPLVTWSWQRSVVLTGAMSVIILLAWFTFPRQQGPLGSGPLSEVSDEAIMEYLSQENISYYDLSENSVIQTAFTTDSTVLNYLDGIDEDYLRSQLEESILSDESI